ncbi:DNA repair protein RadA [Oceanidesulfovibrio indonesiensis]|uniref:DNA repair protein RadA n=1 Tax=Oceanidesulfovibrio indonesiensis TaxID=54767 RepID=A0A7M3MGI0_9BACT|nr:DNA repair protein RadA [Oceanidesulfovibrio indonesiensis]TVM18424.1 DNA repair protein RadA [Oceanidesulfovibrio indonesiensis]
MAKERTVYVCGSCGARTPQWRGQCPTCREWNTLSETVDRSRSVVSDRSGRAPRPSPPGGAGLSSTPVVLGDLSPELSKPEPTGLGGLDRLLGGGLALGAAVLLGGPPGVGKSTLLLQLAGALAAAEKGVLYISGEESLGQLRGRAERLGALTPKLEALATSRLEDALPSLESGAHSLVILDSVQTIASPRTDGLPGSVGQVRAVAAEALELAKVRGFSLIIVGHVTKEGHIAGPKLLEHMVDTVLAMEGDKQNTHRILRVLKNRFGSDRELAVFSMEEKGLAEVTDPSTLFLEDRDPSLSGSALAMAVDGNRPFAVEVQALAAKSYLAMPRRTGLGVDVNRLNLLLAVLEKRLAVNLGQWDIYAKTAGGLRLQDPGVDLALVAAVLSSYYDRPLPPAAVFWGELDLNGRIRPVSGHDIRLEQARRLGWSPIFCPMSKKSEKGVIVPETLSELQNKLFGA